MLLKIVVLLLITTTCASVVSESNIFRPCGFGDLACIRSTISSRARCSPPAGVPPPVLTVPESRFDAPTFNASYVDKNMIIRGLDRCFVSELYLNAVSRGGVLAVNCPMLTIESARVMYQHRPAQEDQIFHYYINSTYPMITFTTPLTKTEPIDFCGEFSNAHVWSLPIFHISPLDKPTTNHLTHDLMLLNIFERETFASRARLFTRAIVNNLICNFGCF